MSEKEPIICIVEDAFEDRAIFRRYLLQDAAYHYHFYEGETGEKGLELCKMVQPDCILLDYNLPDMDGLEFLEQIVDGSGSVPFAVVMLTGVGDEAIAIQAMKSGAQDYLVKDEMTPGSLFRAIHNAIERTSMRRTLEHQRHDLELKNQELQAFAYALAHDLRAPLRAIGGFAQIVDQDYQAVLDYDGQRYVQNIIKATTQMDRLIDELLNYTRIEHRAIRRKPVALSYLIEQVVDGFADRIAAKQTMVTIAEDLPMVYGDPMLLNHIFLNLIDNALTYQREQIQGQIKVDWSSDGQNVIVSIADNGIGIAEKHYEKIFPIFQRLHGDEEYVGTGIGLAIVKKAAELQGGNVWVESQIGVGSTFFVQLPTSL